MVGDGREGHNWLASRPPLAGWQMEAQSNAQSLDERFTTLGASFSTGPDQADAEAARLPKDLNVASAVESFSQRVSLFPFYPLQSCYAC
jgi:hypothetical protein